MSDAVLAKVGSADLAVFLVWIPILDEDTAEAARVAAGRFSDPRITHAWDGERALGDAVGRALSLPPSRRESGRTVGIAWDVYLLYPRGAMFGEVAPRPPFFMHQLDQLRRLPGSAPELDGDALRAEVLRALGH